MKQKILITSALPYANGPLHFGHIAGAYLPGDCYARFERLMKQDVLYICGSDEYGVAITLSADLAKRTPKEQVDLFHAINQSFFKTLNFSFDHYSRTTWPGHIPTTHQYFQELLANGYIEERVTDQLYSEADQKFLADRYVVGTCPRCGFLEARGDECPSCGASYDATDLINPRSKLSSAPLVRKPTMHWFLLLDRFKEKLLAWVESKKWKPNVLNFIKGYIEDLHPRAITRDSTWGVPIPLPGTEGKVLYVWFDAPIGYISATKEWAEKRGHSEGWKDYWFDPSTKLVQFIGKDNITFHASIFPAMTMGQNQPFKLVDELPANEFYNLEGRQFSKSDGWYIDLEDFFTRYSSDQIRYTIASNAPETADSEFTWRDFQLKCNTDLLGKYGNLVNRVLVFAKNRCEGKVPPLHDLAEIDLQFLEKIRLLAMEASESYKAFKMRRASQIVMELSQAGNIYFDAKHPWKDAKDPDLRGRMETTIACCLICLKALALISYPLIPESSEKVWQMLGISAELLSLGWEGVLSFSFVPGELLGEAHILFQKVEDSQIEEEIEKLHAMVKKEKPVEKKEIDQEVEPIREEITFDQFCQQDLRIGVVLEASPLPKSKKLLKLLVDIGKEKRTILSGIAQYYTPEQVIGKKVVIVANLKAATMMGVESHGMVLAAGFGDKLALVEAPELPAGSTIS